MTFLLVLCLSVLSCSKVEVEKLDLPNPEPILEISKDAEGMFDIVGKSLFFRLYDDGLVEYEFPDEDKKVMGRINHIEDIKSSKQIRLSDEKLQKFKNLLKRQDFHQIENQYKRQCCCTDTSLNLDIRIRTDGSEKNIALRGFCDLSEIKNPQPRYLPNFPQVLSDLLILADNIRVK